MAKIPFTKLKLTLDKSVTIVKYNDIDIEVKNYLPLNEKMDLYKRVIDYAIDENGFINPAKKEVAFDIEVILSYTNLNLTDKQKEDYAKLYDLFLQNEFIDLIVTTIPEKEFTELWTFGDSVFDYYEKTVTSFINVLNTFSNQPDNSLSMIQDFLDSIKDNKDVEFLKEISENY